MRGKLTAIGIVILDIFDFSEFQIHYLNSNELLEDFGKHFGQNNSR